MDLMDFQCLHKAVGDDARKWIVPIYTMVRNHRADTIEIL